MLTELVAKYRHKGVLVDTNLLIVYIIGGLNPNYLKECRAFKKQRFSTPDFKLLDQFLGNFRQLVTTPHILTEVSNLLGKLPDKEHPEFRSAFGRVIEQMLERFEPSRSIAGHQDFLRFGLADTAIMMIAPGKHLVLTVEVALYGKLQKRGVDVVNFNHLRFESWK